MASKKKIPPMRTIGEILESFDDQTMLAMRAFESARQNPDQGVQWLEEALKHLREAERDSAALMKANLSPEQADFGNLIAARYKEMQGMAKEVFNLIDSNVERMINS